MGWTQIGVPANGGGPAMGISSSSTTAFRPCVQSGITGRAAGIGGPPSAGLLADDRHGERSLGKFGHKYPSGLVHVGAFSVHVRPDDEYVPDDEVPTPQVAASEGGGDPVGRESHQLAFLIEDDVAV